jgi:hypothetical protein
MKIHLPQLKVPMAKFATAGGVVGVGTATVAATSQVSAVTTSFGSFADPLPYVGAVGSTLLVAGAVGGALLVRGFGAHKAGVELLMNPPKVTSKAAKAVAEHMATTQAQYGKKSGAAALQLTTAAGLAVGTMHGVYRTHERMQALTVEADAGLKEAGNFVDGFFGWMGDMANGGKK